MAVLALVPCAVVGAFLSRAICRNFFLSPDIGSFRVGSTISQDSSKAMDFVFPLAFFGVLIIGGGVAHSLKLTLQNFQHNKIVKFVVVEFFISLPFTLTLIIGSKFPLSGLIDSPFLFCLMIQFSIVLMCARPHGYINDETGSNTFNYLLFFGALGPFPALGLTVLGQVFLPELIASSKTSIGSFIVLSLLIIRLTPRFLTSNYGNYPESCNWIFVAFAIASTPLLLPPVLYYNMDKVGASGVQLSRWFIFIGIICVLAVFETTYRTRDSRQISENSSLSSIGLAIFIVLLREQITWPSLSSDGFHFGEFFTPFELWNRYGQMPYTDIIPAHGVILSYIPSMWNHLLNDGSATNWGYGRFAGLIVISVVAHLIIRKAVGLIIATTSVFLLASTDFRNEGELLLIALLIGAIYVIRHVKSPEIIGLSCLACCSASVFLYPMWGAVAVLSVIFVLAIGMLGGFISRNRNQRTFVFRLGLALIFCSVVLMSGPIGESLHDSIHYVVVTGRNNNDAFGISLDAILKIPFVLGVPLSFLFVLGLYFSLFVSWKERRHFSSFDWDKGIDLGLLLLPAFLVAVLMGRYLGRVDAVAWSLRSTTGSLFILGFIIPFVVRLFAKDRWKLLGHTSLCIALFVSIIIFPIGGGGLIRSATLQLETPLAWQTAKLNLLDDTVGLGQGDNADVGFLTYLSEVVSKIEGDEEVLNISNRIALNGLFDWKSPTKILTPYTLTSDQEEGDYISQIRLVSPKFLFVGPGVWHDGISLSLRNPLLYRWVLENYNPFQCGPSFWAIEKRSDIESVFNQLGCPKDSTSTFGDARSLWSNFVGSPKDLLKIPQAWGRRGSSLLANQSSSLNVSSKSLTNGFTDFELLADTPTSILEKVDFDLLAVESVCSKAQETDTSSTTSFVPSSKTAIVKWGAGPNDYSTFEWSDGKLIIPLDVFPSWFLNVALRSPLILKVPSRACNGKLDIQAKGIKR